jgi:hypothetical protein
VVSALRSSHILQENEVDEAGKEEGTAAESEEKRIKMFERLAKETLSVSIEDVHAGRDPTALYYIDDDQLAHLGLFDVNDDDSEYAGEPHEFVGVPPFV